MKMEIAVADEIRSIFYASSKKKALTFFDSFRDQWEKEVPSALKCPEKSLQAYLTYLDFSKEEWVCLLTTNVIERLNKGIKAEQSLWRSLQGKDLVILLSPLSV